MTGLVVVGQVDTLYRLLTVRDNCPLNSGNAAALHVALYKEQYQSGAIFHARGYIVYG